MHRAFGTNNLNIPAREKYYFTVCFLIMVSALHDEAVISFFILILKTQFLHCLSASERLLCHKRDTKGEILPRKRGRDL